MSSANRSGKNEEMAIPKRSGAINQSMTSSTNQQTGQMSEYGTNNPSISNAKLNDILFRSVVQPKGTSALMASEFTRTGNI